jgi:hypothetical protein
LTRASELEIGFGDVEHLGGGVFVRLLGKWSRSVGTIGFAGRANPKIADESGFP